MNKDIEKLKEKLKKILENYEIDKKIGQLSVDSIYHMFPTESKILLDYIEQLQNNWNELKKWCKENQYDDNFDSYQVDNYTTYGVILKKMEEMEQGKDE